MGTMHEVRNVELMQGWVMIYPYEWMDAPKIYRGLYTLWQSVTLVGSFKHQILKSSEPNFGCMLNFDGKPTTKPYLYVFLPDLRGKTIKKNIKQKHIKTNLVLATLVTRWCPPTSVCWFVIPHKLVPYIYHNPNRQPSDVHQLSIN